jgi:hypothetical protein
MKLTALPTLALALFAFAAIVCADDAPPAAPPQTGPFEITFTQRSPLSDIKELTRRLGLEKPGEDYDLSKHPFLVFVPPNYDPAKPMGLLVLALYKSGDPLPEPVFSQLTDANIALVVLKTYVSPWWHRAGLNLDAAHNMRQLYQINPRRVYVFGGGDWQDQDGTRTEVAPQLGFAYSDVFTGMFSSNHLSNYRPILAANGGKYPPQIRRPLLREFNLAKAHPIVISIEDKNAEFPMRSTESYKQDGFRHLKIVTVTSHQYHYPNFTTDWLPDILAYMDEVTAKLKLPGEKPQPPEAPKQ